MSMKIHRYDYGALPDFRGPILVHALAEEVAEIQEIEATPPPSFSEDDMESARSAAHQLGYAEGVEAGLTQAKREADATTNATQATVAALHQAMQLLQQEYRQLLTRESGELASLVLMIAKKVAGEAMDARGGETIQTLVERCLPVIFSKPRIVIDLHPERFETVLERVEALLRAQGIEGDVQFRANPNLGTHDVVIDWGAGQASRSTAALWQEIETLLERVPLELTFQETLTKTTAQGE